MEGFVPQLLYGAKLAEYRLFNGMNDQSEYGTQSSIGNIAELTVVRQA